MAGNRRLSTTASLFQAAMPSRPRQGAKNSDKMMSKCDKHASWKLPPGSWDTHFHFFDPEYPYSPSRAFTPPAALRESFEAFNASLTSTGNSSSLVLVQPSVYGTDNSLTLNFLRKERNNSTGRDARAIVVLDLENVTDKELIDMHALGVRGVRFNMASSGIDVQASDVKKRISEVVERLQGVEMLKDWLLQLFIAGHLWEGIEDTVRDLPFRIIADHHGGMKGKTDLPPGCTTDTQPGFASLMRLARNGKVFVKISAGYRSSNLTKGGYDDLEELIKIFASEVPNQLIWASDWPHTGSAKDRPTAGIEVLEPFRRVDNEAVLKNLRNWMGETAWMSMMVDNPRRIFK